MSYKDIQAGDKTAKIKAARFVTAKTGSVGMEVAFEFLENDQLETLYWIGWLSEKAIKFTMETLVDVLEFNGNDTCDANGMLTDPKALAYGKEVKLVVEIEKYTKQDGTEGYSPKIKWVNKIGGAMFSGATPEVIKNSLGAVGFKAHFLAAKQSQPKTQQVAESKLPF